MVSAPRKSDAELAELLETLEAAHYIKEYGGKYRFFLPHPKQREHLELGSTKRERLLMAGNRLGKCVSYQTLIDHPDGTSTPAGVLFERGEPFPVMALSGD